MPSASFAPKCVAKKKEITTVANAADVDRFISNSQHWEKNWAHDWTAHVTENMKKNKRNQREFMKSSLNTTKFQLTAAEDRLRYFTVPWILNLFYFCRKTAGTVTSSIKRNQLEVTNNTENVSFVVFLITLKNAAVGGFWSVWVLEAALHEGSREMFIPWREKKFNQLPAHVIAVI